MTVSAKEARAFKYVNRHCIKRRFKPATQSRRKAIENSCYLLAPAQVGNIYIGHSMVVDPLGRTIVDLNEKEGFEIVNLDLKLVTETREKLPLLKNRRTDVYARHPLTK